MTLNLDKEIEDIVAEPVKPQMNWLLVSTTSLVTLLIVAIIGGFAGYIRVDSPTANKVKIKGNRSSMIYHLERCPNYADVSERNTVWFETEGSARSAGYRMARNCDLLKPENEIPNPEAYNPR